MKDIVTDFSQFGALRASAAESDPAALKQVAEQFESLFLESMLKSMRKASMGDPIFGASNQDALYQQMFDQQLAREVSGGPGIGLAEMLVRQLSPSGGDFAATESLPAPTMQRAVAVRPEAQTLSPSEFARKLWPYAKRVSAELGTEPQAVLAQAALETGWGKRLMERADGVSSNNFFGIKASRDWQGEAVSKPTLEYNGDIPRRERAEFRAYESESAGFTDYLNFLSDNERYKDVFGHGSDIKGFATALQDAGYATDPAYAEKIVAIADSSTMKEALAGLKFGGLTPIDQ